MRQEAIGAKGSAGSDDETCGFPTRVYTVTEERGVENEKERTIGVSSDARLAPNRFRDSRRLS